MTRDDVPAQWRPVYDRAMTGKSKAAAVKAHCLMCCGWSRGEAVRCTAPSCPLFPYRPGASSTTSRRGQTPRARGGAAPTKGGIDSGTASGLAP